MITGGDVSRGSVSLAHAWLRGGSTFGGSMVRRSVTVVVVRSAVNRPRWSRAMVVLLGLFIGGPFGCGSATRRGGGRGRRGTAGTAARRASPQRHLLGVVLDQHQGERVAWQGVRWRARRRDPRPRALLDPVPPGRPDGAAVSVRRHGGPP